MAIQFAQVAIKGAKICNACILQGDDRLLVVRPNMPQRNPKQSNPKNGAREAEPTAY
ncbi:hypothetical protein SH449x_002334 [Pirellulaceae bacterium SH449]